jgi:hypothetical protein
LAIVKVARAMLSQSARSARSPLRCRGRVLALGVQSSIPLGVDPRGAPLADVADIAREVAAALFAGMPNGPMSRKAPNRH